jgi:hypothetical protein
MNNRNFPPGPFPNLPPELLAQIASAAFRPPPLMSAPSLPSAPHVRAGMSLGEGFKLLNEGLDKWLAKSPSPTAPRLMAGVVNAQSPSPSPGPQPLPPIDFLTGIWERQWGNFRA